MYLIFISVSLLCLFQSTLPLDIASEETLKQSLLQVDKFLDKVEQSIQRERNYLRTVRRRQAYSSANTQKYEKEITSFEEFAGPFYDENEFKDAPVTKQETKYNNDETLVKVMKDNLNDATFNYNNHPNFMSALAALNNNKIYTGSTKKLSNAIFGLKQLVKQDIEVKSDRNVVQATNELLRQMKEKLTENKGANKNESKENPIQKKDENKAVDDDTIDKKEEKDDSDIFGDMDFPTQADFPVPVTLKTTAATPEALNSDFVGDPVDSDADDFLKTPTPTTQLGDKLLDPRAFGFTTTRKPVSVYGEILETHSIPDTFITTTKAPNAFAEEYKEEMKKIHMGVFSVAMIRMFAFARDKEAKLVRKLTWGLGRLIESYHLDGKLNHFGQPTHYALHTTTSKIGSMRPDELKTHGMMMYNSMVLRREMFSKDINSIIDYIDSLYLKKEEDEVIASVEELHDYNNQSRVPYRELRRFTKSIFEPFERLKTSPRGEILKESLNRGIRNHFYPKRVFTEYERRRNYHPVKNNITRRAKINERNGIKNRNAKQFVIRRNIDNTNLKEAQEFWKTKNPYGLSPIQEQPFTFLNKVNDPYDAKPLEEQGFTTSNNYDDSYPQGPLQEQALTSLNYNKDPIDQSQNQNQIFTSSNNHKDSISQRPIQGQVFTPVINQEYAKKLIQRQAVSLKNNIRTANNRNVFEKIKSTGPISPIVPMTVTRQSRPRLNDNKRLVSINKRDSASGNDRVFKLSSGKHHKHKHSHKHMKQKLAKILRIIKQYKPNKKGKHKKHHHKHRTHKNNFRSYKDEGISHKSVVNKEKQTELDSLDNRDGIHDVPEQIDNNDDAARVLDVNDANLNFRRNLEYNNNNDANVHVIEQPSYESDEEIPLKINLYKAMALTLTTNHVDDQRGVYRNKDAMAFKDDKIITQDNKRDFDENDEETLLKNKLYDYFSRNIPVN